MYIHNFFLQKVSWYYIIFKQHMSYKSLVQLAVFLWKNEDSVGPDIY